MTAPAGRLVAMEDVWRRYRTVAGPHATTLRGLLTGRGRGGRRASFWALQGVDLAVDRGDAVALVGRNGAGKSTLLRLIGGVGRPDRGTLHVRGRVGALLDLGREFHPDLTGRQNAEMAAVVAGLTRRQFRDRFDEIVAFAELEEFIDQPVRAYSDGMHARLAFSVIAHVEPELLLVDETLAVGDAPFQRRSIDRIAALRAHGTAVVFVSHDLSLARHVCDRGVWLDDGRVRAAGDVREVVEAYVSGTAVPVERPQEADVPALGLDTVEVLDAWEVPTTRIRSGDGLVVRVAVRGDDAPLQLSVRMHRPGSEATLVDTSTPVRAGDRSVHAVRFLRLDLAPGVVEVDVGLYSADWTAVHDLRTVELAVGGEGPDDASMAPPHEWSGVPEAQSE